MNFKENMLADTEVSKNDTVLPAASVPILVCGLGRCGSSMVMRMLDMAGVPVFADNCSAYEHDRLNGDSDIGALVPELCGKAAKVLDPNRHRNWPARLDAKVIWLDRDFAEQAKSQIKFLRACSGEFVPGQAWRSMAKSLPPDRATCLQMFADMGVEVLCLRFEIILRAPRSAAESIASFLGLGHAAIERAASIVIPRSPMCAKDISIEIAAVERDLTARS